MQHLTGGHKHANWTLYPVVVRNNVTSTAHSSQDTSPEDMITLKSYKQEDYYMISDSLNASARDWANMTTMDHLISTLHSSGKYVGASIAE